MGELGTVGTSIRQRRIAVGLTQRQLAQAAGLSVTVLRDLEQGITRTPRAVTMSRLVEVLGPEPQGARSNLEPPAYGVLEKKSIRPADGLSVQVLGPVAAWRDGAPVLLGSVRCRAVLAILALRPGQLVHRDTISDLIWQHDPPATASSMVQNAVSYLRRALAASSSRSILATSGRKYRLTPGSGQLDFTSYTQLAEAAATARCNGDCLTAWDLYDKALALWTDEPAADIEVLQTSPLLAALRTRHANLIADYAEDASAHGNHGRVLPHLHAQTLRDPFDERAHACLMVALAGVGNQAAALATYDRIRAQLDSNLGVTPGPLLRTAHARVLRGDYRTPHAAKIESGSNQHRWDARVHVCPSG